MKAKTTDPTTLLRDRCLSHFTTLRVPVQSAALDELLTRAEKENLSYLSLLDRLLGAEAGARRERAVARRIRDARFRENNTLEGFDWNFNPKTFNRVQMEETGHRRLHPAPHQSRHGGLEWDREKTGLSPMQAVALGLAGWMAADLVHILTRGRHPMKGLTVKFDGHRASSQPARFTRVGLHCDVTGEVARETVERAIQLSRDKY